MNHAALLPLDIPVRNGTLPTSSEDFLVQEFEARNCREDHGQALLHCKHMRVQVIEKRAIVVVVSDEPEFSRVTVVLKVLLEEMEN